MIQGKNQSENYVEPQYWFENIPPRNPRPWDPEKKALPVVAKFTKVAILGTRRIKPCESLLKAMGILVKGGEFSDRQWDFLGKFTAQKTRYRQGKIEHESDLIIRSWIEERLTAAVWPAVETIWEAQWELDGEVVHGVKKYSIDYRQSDFTEIVEDGEPPVEVQEGDEEDEVEGPIINPPGRWGEPKLAHFAGEPEFNTDDVIVFRGDTYPISEMDNFDPEPPCYPGFPPLHSGLHAVEVTGSNFRRCWHPWSKSPHDKDEFGTWNLTYVDGPHAGESFQIPFSPKVRCDVSNNLGGYWIRDGKIAWLSRHQLACARGLVPGSEPWNKEPSMGDMPEISEFDYEEIEIPEDDDHDVLIPGFLRKKELAVLVGPLKAGKTMMTLDMAVAAASGTEWITGKPAKKMRVLIIDAEMNREDIMRRLHWSCQRRGITLADIMPMIRIHPLKECGALVTVEHLYRQAHQMASFKPDIITADNLKALLPTTEGLDDDNNPRAMRKVMLMWREFLKAFGPDAGLCLVAHHPKGSEASMQDALEMISGTFVTGASVDSGLALAQENPGKRIPRHKWPWVLCNQPRRGKRFRFKIKKTPCEKWWIRSDGPKAKPGDEDTAHATDVPLDDQAEGIASLDAVYDLIGEAGGKLSRNAIAKGMGVSRAKALKIISAWIEHGKLLQIDDMVSRPPAG